MVFATSKTKKQSLLPIEGTCGVIAKLLFI